MESGHSDVSTASGDPNDTQENFDDLGAALVINDFLWVVPRAASCSLSASRLIPLVWTIDVGGGCPARNASSTHRHSIDSLALASAGGLGLPVSLTSVAAF